jgi:AbrB family looped-hinge helix DNA binding protein
VPRDGYLLFVGTLEPRKNLGVLLDAYAILLETRTAVPTLVIVGRTTPEAGSWLARIAEPPLAGRVRVLGYISDAERENVYAGARVLILPSLDEGFGLPALEAMSAGVPVVASSRGALPEVVGTGGMLFDPTRPADLAAALDQLGRVVVPAELRRMLSIRQGDMLDIRVEGGHLVLFKIDPECAICGREDELVELHEKHVCKDCVRDISLV